MISGDNTLLEVKGLKTYFFLDEGTVRALDGVDFNIQRGQTLGVVGESGCGKSVTARSILRIVPKPGRTIAGEITLHRVVDDRPGTFVTEPVKLSDLNPKGKEMRNIRGAEIALVPQEPMASLSPVHTIGNQIMEAILLHQKVNKAEAREKAIDMLRLVGFPQPKQRVDSYPYQLSGGLRQRAVIAMALSCHPSLLIADEPTTALDVTTEAQILELLLELQSDFGMAMQYITHNLGVVAELVDDVVVMYLGKPVEYGPVEAIFEDPRHPYTRALLRSIPKLGKKSHERLASIKGMVPDPYRIPAGCAFHPRCPRYRPGVCDEPVYMDVGPEHQVLCNRAGDPWE